MKLHRARNITMWRILFWKCWSFHLVLGALPKNERICAVWWYNERDESYRYIRVSLYNVLVNITYVWSLPVCLCHHWLRYRLRLHFRSVFGSVFGFVVVLVFIFVFIFVFVLIFVIDFGSVVVLVFIFSFVFVVLVSSFSVFVFISTFDFVRTSRWRMASANCTIASCISNGSRDRHNHGWLGSANCIAACIISSCSDNGSIGVSRCQGTGGSRTSPWSGLGSGTSNFRLEPSNIGSADDIPKTVCFVSSVVVFMTKFMCQIQIYNQDDVYDEYKSRMIFNDCYIISYYLSSLF